MTYTPKTWTANSEVNSTELNRVEEGIQEALAGVGGGDLAAHIADTTGAHPASAISVTPGGSMASTNVQAALEEIFTEAGGGGGGSGLDGYYVVGSASYPTMASAVSAAGAGGLVYFPPGVYTLSTSSSIQPPNNQQWILNDAIIRCTAEGTTTASWRMVDMTNGNLTIQGYGESGFEGPTSIGTGGGVVGFFQDSVTSGVLRIDNVKFSKLSYCIRRGSMSVASTSSAHLTRCHFVGRGSGQASQRTLIHWAAQTDGGVGSYLRIHDCIFDAFGNDTAGEENLNHGLYAYPDVSIDLDRCFFRNGIGTGYCAQFYNAATSAAPHYRSIRRCVFESNNASQVDALSMNMGHTEIDECHFFQAGSSIQRQPGASVRAQRCRFHSAMTYANFNGRDIGSAPQNVQSYMVFERCEFKQTGSFNVVLCDNADDNWQFIECDFRTGGTNVIRVTAACRVEVKNCRFHTIGSTAGIQIAGSPTLFALRDNRLRHASGTFLSYSSGTVARFEALGNMLEGAGSAGANGTPTVEIQANNYLANGTALTF